jgi:uncharacterized tellurite resistance protein B-like protein
LHRQLKSKEMSIADVFESGEQKQNKGHFRNLVMIAKADGVVDDEELQLLKNIARQIGLSDEHFDQIIEKPEDYPINPPENKEERNERLYHLVQMVLADEGIAVSEVKKVRKFAVALGYPVDKAEDVAVKATRSVIDGADLDSMSSMVDEIVLS